MVIGLTHQLPLEREMSAVCLPPPKAFKDDEDQIDTDRVRIR